MAEVQNPQPGEALKRAAAGLVNTGEDPVLAGLRREREARYGGGLTPEEQTLHDSAREGLVELAEGGMDTLNKRHLGRFITNALSNSGAFGYRLGKAGLNVGGLLMKPLDYALHHKGEIAAGAAGGAAAKTAMRLLLAGSGGIAPAMAIGAAGGAAGGALKEYVKQRGALEIEEAGNKLLIDGLMNEFRRIGASDKGKIRKAALRGAAFGMAGAVLSDAIAENEWIQGQLAEMKKFVPDIKKLQLSPIFRGPSGLPAAEVSPTPKPSLAAAGESSPTSTGTATPTPTTEPTPTPTRAPTMTPTTEATPTPKPPTLTPTSEPALAQSPSASPTLTPSPTATAAEIASSPTPSPTATLEPTATPTEAPPSPTATPAELPKSPTPTPIASPTPEEAVATPAPAVSPTPEATPGAAPQAPAPLEAAPAVSDTLTIPQGSSAYVEIQNYLQQNNATGVDINEAVRKALADSNITDPRAIPAGTQLDIHGVNEMIGKVVPQHVEVPQPPDIPPELVKMPEIMELPAGSNPWNVVSEYGEEYLGRPLTNAEKLLLTKELCKQSGIAIPSWNLNEGVDHTKLPVGFRLIFNDPVKQLLEELKTA